MEFAPDPSRQQNLDDQMRYTAYVPKGSIKRGRFIARFGADRPTAPCISCHGEKLRGVGAVPPIAGRSPTYLLRQLLAFKTAARAGLTSQPMQGVTADLNIRNMIDVAAYAASLAP
jgi:cytochrome c553